ncbi:MAG: RlmE family RNA methyltransferase [Rhodobiaceae bacterium]|nr:RlmE family RNA methyltransferase [Rhodobiaceae bacterium]MCC0056565.1 RlmE family RNA methyltransferase [Rhodobiaceae bacterium]
MTGRRKLKQRVKTRKGRSVASARWLERQLNDPYVAEAKAAGYRSRAAFKLAEIDDRYGLLKPGMSVVDLGAAPGGWSQVAAIRVDAASGKGQVVGIDILGMEPIPDVTLLEMDFLDDDAPERLKQALGGPVEAVLSDMAAPTTGHRATDHLRTLGLVEAAYEFAVEILKPGGFFLAKVFRGGTEGELLQRMKRDFTTVRHVKPPSSRAESVELYVLATGFRGEG